MLIAKDPQTRRDARPINATRAAAAAAVCQWGPKEYGVGSFIHHGPGYNDFDFNGSPLPPKIPSSSSRIATFPLTPPFTRSIPGHKKSKLLVYILHPTLNAKSE